MPFFNLSFYPLKPTKGEKKIVDDLKLEKKPQRTPHHGPAMSKKQIRMMNKMQKRGQS